MKRIFLTIFSITSLLASGLVAAQVEHRCNGIDPFHTMSDQDFEEIVATFPNGCVRLQVGDNAIMDGLVGAAYDNALQTWLDNFEEAKSRFAARGIKSLFSFYSPPGGFESRVGPARHAMFSDVALQTQYLETLVTITNRFGDDPDVIAIQINNEPAPGANPVCAGCRDWPTLLVEAVRTIRAINQNVVLYLNPEYSDPSKLSSVPVTREIIENPNNIAAVHAYPFVAYQHAGEEAATADLARPSEKKIKNAMYKYIADYVKKYRKAWKKEGLEGQAPNAIIAFPESAMSNRSNNEPEVFMGDLLKILNQNYLDDPKPNLGKKKNCNKLKKAGKKRAANKCKAKKNEILARKATVHLWSWHALEESKLWSVKQVPSGPGPNDYTDVGFTTDRFNVLHSFHDLN